MHISALLCFTASCEILWAHSMPHSLLWGLPAGTDSCPATLPSTQLRAGRAGLELGARQGRAPQRTTCSRGRGARWAAVEGPHRL